MADSVKVIFEAIDKSLSKTAQDVSKSIGGVSDSAPKAASGLTGIYNGMMSIVKAAGPYLGALSAAGKILLDVITASAQAEMTLARVEATIQSTGRSSEITSKQLQKMAETEMRGSIFDDEQILEATNALLRFNSVSTENIPKITGVVLDMASALGTDATTAAHALGNALETGLIPRTWGFSAALKQQIRMAVEAGDEEKALSLIVGELTDRFGGQALTALATYTGATTALKNEWGNLKESGEDLLPILTLIKFGFADMLVLVQDNIEASSGGSQFLQDMSDPELASAIEQVNQKIKDATTYTDQYTAAMARQTLMEEAARRRQVYSGGGVELETTIKIDPVIDASAVPSAINDALHDVNTGQTYEATINLYMRFTADKQQYEKSIQDLLAKGAEIRDKILELREGGISKKEQPEFEELRQELQDVTSDIDDATEAYKKLQKQMAFNLLMEKFKGSGGGIDEKEFTILTEWGEQLGLIDPAAVEQMNAMLDAISDVDADSLSEAKQDVAYLLAADGKTITIYVNQIVTTTETGDGGDGGDGGSDQPSGNVPEGGYSSNIGGPVINYGPIYSTAGGMRDILKDLR